MTKIVHITSIHPWNDTRIYLKECRSLAWDGYKVVLIAPRDADISAEGVQVRAFPPVKDRFGRMKVLPQILRLALAERADAYHFHDPELLLVGLLLRLRGHRVIYDVHENYAGAILDRDWLKPWVASVVSRLWKLFEKPASRAMSLMVAATPRIGDQFDPARTIVVQNFPMEGELAPLVGRSSNASQLIYHGGISVARGCWPMLDALALLNDLPEIRLCLAGPVRPSLLEEMTRHPAWTRVDYLPWLDRPQLAEQISRSFAGLVLFQPARNHVEAQPNKLFEYMSAGLPVIASDFPLWRETVEQNGCGVNVDPGNPQAIADAIRRLAADRETAQKFGNRGRELIASRYNWANEFSTLKSAYGRILATQ